jgi:hypothetical protein
MTKSLSPERIKERITHLQVSAERIVGRLKEDRPEDINKRDSLLSRLDEYERSIVNLTTHGKETV